MQLYWCLKYSELFSIVLAASSGEYARLKSGSLSSFSDQMLHV